MALGKKDNLREHLSTIHVMLKRLVDDISEEESVTILGDNPNHIKWQTGHLVFTAVLAARTLGGEIPVPDGWAAIFRRGATAPDPGAKLPLLSEIRTVLYSSHERVQALIDQTSDEYLDTNRVIAPNWEASPMSALLFLAAHDFYHGGQIAMIRRAIGRERSFG
jgi:hypothetical protein